MKPLTGKVISNRMTNTAVVEVETKWQHPLYKKTVKRTKNYLAHDTQGVQVGNLVTIKPSRPISKRKRWTITQTLSK
jgi:small subunit ribosomal protein S17